jgi:hypothetical protein
LVATGAGGGGGGGGGGTASTTNAIIVGGSGSEPVAHRADSTSANTTSRWRLIEMAAVVTLDASIGRARRVVA